MRKSRQLALSLTSLVALLSACSSSGGGGDAPSNPFVPGGGGASGSGGQVGVNGGAGGLAGVSGSPGEGQGGSALDPGTGGTANAGGAAGGAPVTDVIAEPGLGFFKLGDWQGYAWTAIESDPVAGATTRAPTDYTALPDGDPYCLAGTVAADPPTSPTSNDGYQGFAMMGFNINQAGVP
jgi:hypothetical protein